MLAFGFAAPAKAVWPALAAAYAWLGTSSGIALQTSVALHASLLAIHFTPTNSAPANADAPVLTVMLNPKAELPNRPAGWGAPSAGSPQPTPPATTSYNPPPASIPAVTGSVISCSSAEAFFNGQPPKSAVMNASGRICTTACSNSAAVATLVAAGYIGGGNQVNANCTSPATMISFTGPNTPCPTGYTYSSGTVACNLTTPSAVQKPSDNKIAYVRSGNTFVPDVQDITDQVSASELNVVKSASSNSIDVFNETTGQSTTITANSDGTSTVSSYTPNTGTNTTVKNVTQLSAPNASTGEVKVIGQYSQSLDGLGPTAPAASPAIDVEIDTSLLNKEATQTQIKTGIDTVNQNLTVDDATQAALEAAGASQVADQNADILSAITGVEHDEQFSLFEEVGDLVKPFFPSGVSCVPWSGSVMGNAFSFDMCPWIQQLNDLIGWLLVLWSMFTVYRIALGSD